jgi:hypothetical protein
MAGELDPGSDTRDRPTVHEDVDLYLGAGDEEEAEEASEETKRGKKGAATLNWILGALPNEWLGDRSRISRYSWMLAWTNTSRSVGTRRSAVGHT